MNITFFLLFFFNGRSQAIGILKKILGKSGLNILNNIVCNNEFIIKYLKCISIVKGFLKLLYNNANVNLMFSIKILQNRNKCKHYKSNIVDI